MPGYTFLEHTTDAFIEADGASLEEAFSNAARGLTDTMIDIRTVKERTEERFRAQGRDRESLLYNWLESILIKVTTDGLVFSSFEVKIRETDEGYELEGRGRGEKLNPRKHKSKTEVKAVTYHLMKIREEAGRVSVRFLLDL